MSYEYSYKKLPKEWREIKRWRAKRDKILQKYLRQNYGSKEAMKLANKEANKKYGKLKDIQNKYKKNISVSHLLKKNRKNK